MRWSCGSHPELLERIQTTHFGRNRGQAVDPQLHSNASATSESATATHAQQRQLRHEKHARRDLGECVAAELMATASKQRHADERKRRTLSDATRVRCAMLSDTTTSCRRTSCGERAPREATTKRETRKAHVQLGRIAHSLLLDRAVFFRHIKNNGRHVEREQKTQLLVLSNVESRPHAMTRYAADITPTHKNTQKRIRSQLVIFSCSVTASRVQNRGRRRVCVRGSLIQSVFGRRGVIHYMARTCRARATAPS